MNLIIINGPNLNLLSKREPEIYGTMPFNDYLSLLQSRYQSLTIDHFQSNVEGEIINKLHDCGFGNYNGIILNAGGYTHTSVAIADAIAAIQTPVVEVHISNIAARENYRHTSLIAGNCLGSIAGFGLASYQLAVDSFLND